MKIFGAQGVEHAFREGRITFAVYGLGKMGLPLAAVIADRGGKVIGVDVNADVVRNINLGLNHIKEEQGLDELVEANVREGRLKATTDLVGASKEADVMIILVPAFLDESSKPDLSILTSVAKNISKGLRKGDFVIVETTVPPGTTDKVMRPILEDSGLKAGLDFGLAHCPERTSSGRAIMDIQGAYPKVVGGLEEKSTEAAEAIYKVINERGVITVSSTDTAEMVKIAEGLHRDVNIALANELALISNEKEVDVWEVIEVANTDPNCNLLEPGVGVGGHCIPVYPWFVINGNGTTKLIRTAREVNDKMSNYVVNKVTESLKASGKDIKGSNILVAGLVYRPGVKETYNSPSRKVIKELRALGANVFGHDPVLGEKEMVDLLGVESPNGHKIDCTVSLHNRNYSVGLNAENKITPMNMFK
jgi:nucleotide sugar dehydrogenase